MAFEGGHPKKNKGIRGGGVSVKYVSKTLKWHDVLISKKFFRTNIVDRIQIYYRLFFCLKIPLDVISVHFLSLSFDFLRFSFLVLLLLMCCLCMPLNMLS